MNNPEEIALGLKEFDNPFDCIKSIREIIARANTSLEGDNE